MVADDAAGAFVAVCQMEGRAGNDLVVAVPGHLEVGNGIFLPATTLVDTHAYMESPEEQ